MNNDLIIIKKKYGEEMMHFCRDAFSTILEKDGELSELLLDLFEPSHDLYKDLKRYYCLNDFKRYIYYIYNLDNEDKIKEEVSKTPEELMSDAGYILYECKSEEDIQSFKKYYAKGEELCTFNGGRLDRCFVFFAFKKNVDEIKRDPFKKPERQDEYGTSVISIQFSRDNSHTLSIKNRYNHRVVNPDATFSNNLDNIIPGLTDSFEKFYGIIQKNKHTEFEIPNYVMAEDGKFYKYNFEYNGIYYCTNNVVICNGIVERLPKEKYLLFDYFILDLGKKKISSYSEKDSFIDGVQDVKNLKIKKENDEKIITIIPFIGEEIEIKLDKDNNIISYRNNNLEKVENNFLSRNNTLKYLECLNLQIIKANFLYTNHKLSEVNIPSVKEIGNNFLYHNKSLQEIALPNAITIGDDFLCNNEKIKKVELSSVQVIGNKFLFENDDLEELSLPNVEKIDYYFLNYNMQLKELYCPNLIQIGGEFLFSNLYLKTLDLPKVEKIGTFFLYYNKKLKSISAPLLTKIDQEILCHNKLMVLKYLFYLLKNGKRIGINRNYDNSLYTYEIKDIIPKRTKNRRGYYE